MELGPAAAQHLQKQLFLFPSRGTICAAPSPCLFVGSVTSHLAVPFNNKLCFLFKCLDTRFWWFWMLLAFSVTTDQQVRQKTITIEESTHWCLINSAAQKTFSQRITSPSLQIITPHSPHQIELGIYLWLQHQYYHALQRWLIIILVFCSIQIFMLI